MRSLEKHGIRPDTLGRWASLQADILDEIELGRKWVRVQEVSDTHVLLPICSDQATMSESLSKEDMEHLGITNVTRKSYINCDGCLFVPDLEHFVACYDKLEIPPGSQWILMTKPPPAAEFFENSQLKAHLQSGKTKFSFQETTKMRLGDVSKNSCIKVVDKYYRPVISTKGSKIYGWFPSSEDFVQEILRQEIDSRCFYELITSDKKCGLYLDFDGETPDVDSFMKTVKAALSGIQLFLCKLKGLNETDVKFHVSNSTRTSSEGRIKGSVHVVSKSVFFANNIEDKKLERFVSCLKRYIGDGAGTNEKNLAGVEFDLISNGLIDPNVYTRNRAMRPDGCCKRGSTVPLIKINVGTTAELVDSTNYSLNSADIEASLVTTVPDDAIEVTHDDIIQLESFVMQAEVGLFWKKTTTIPSKGIKVHHADFENVFRARLHLQRHELDKMLEKNGLEFLTCQHYVTFKPTEESSREIMIKPVIRHTKRFLTLQAHLQSAGTKTGGNGLAIKKRKVEHVVQAITEKGDVEKDIPDFAKKIFCGPSTKIQRVPCEASILPAYAQQCIEAKLVKSIDFFYLESPCKCPYDVIMLKDTRKMHTHRSNNMRMMRISTDAEEDEIFVFCNDDECRQRFTHHLRGIPSARDFRFKTMTPLPPLTTPNEDKTGLHAIFETPFGLSSVMDRDARLRLKNLYEKSPEQLMRVMNGDEVGKHARILWSRFLDKKWPKLFKLNTTLDQFLQGGVSKEGESRFEEVGAA